MTDAVCALHPRYRGIRPPRSTKPGCTCTAVYAAAHPTPGVLAIDPGASPGFAWDAYDYVGVGTSPDSVPLALLDEVVIEDQFLARHIYRNGRRVRVSPRSQITLIRTAERLLLQFPVARRYRISPTAWRGILWPGSNRLPKKTVLARLRAAEPALLRDATDDAVEARGILRAWLTLTPVQKRKYLVA